jgi:hypothetical protein
MPDITKQKESNDFVPIISSFSRFYTKMGVFPIQKIPSAHKKGTPWKGVPMDNLSI